MRDFEGARAELKLQPFLASPLGQLYLRPPSDGRVGVIARRFDPDHRARAGALASLLGAAQRWIERHDPLARLLRVEQPVEVGHDFVARPHHVYHTSTDAYVDDEDPPEPPPEFAAMRAAFKAAVAGASTESERLLVSILTRAAVEPTGKTYFNEAEGRFIAVDLSPRAEELDRWAELTARAPSST